MPSTGFKNFICFLIIALFLTTNLVYGQSVNEILTAYFNLNGGQMELCSHFKNSKITQKIIIHSNGDTLETTSINADKIGGSEEMIVNLGGTFLKQVSTYTTTKGWDIKITQYEGSSPDTTSIKAWTLTQVKSKFNCVSDITRPCCVDFSRFKLIGTEEFENVQCYSIEEKQNKAGRKVIHYFGVTSKQCLGSKVTQTTEKGDMTNTIILFKDYRKYKNILIPYLIEETEDGYKTSSIPVAISTKLKYTSSNFEVRSKVK